MLTTISVGDGVAHVDLVGGSDGQALETVTNVPRRLTGIESDGCSGSLGVCESWTHVVGEENLSERCEHIYKESTTRLKL